MKITSMTNLELYKTLTGQDFPNPNKTNNSESVKPAAAGDVKSKGEIKWKQLSDEEMKKITLSEDKSSITSKNIDRFVSSGKIDNSEFFKNISSDGVKLIDDIDFNDKYVQYVLYSRNFSALSSGIEGGVPTKERIADYYGKMAKRLDKAFSEGKFTKEEYDYLNKGIAERMEHSAKCAEETAAERAAGYDRTMSYEASTQYLAMSKEGRKEYMQSKVNEYIDKYFKIDRTSLMKLFNAIRYGK